MNTSALVTYYDPGTRWGRPFGWRPPAGEPNPYTISGFHRGQDLRKLGPGGGYSVPTDVVSLSAGRVVQTYVGTSTGREVVVDTGRARGRYEIHCHNASGHLSKGSWVEAGGWLARNATAGQRPGTAWDAPHDHFLISDFMDAGHENRPVYDPREFIRAALAAVQPPAPTPKAIKENPMQFALVLYTPTNNLLIVDLFGRKIYELGDGKDKSGLRQYYSMMPYASLSAKEWDTRFPLKTAQNPNGYEYVRPV